MDADADAGWFTKYNAFIRAHSTLKLEYRYTKLCSACVAYTQI